ncbi:MAG: HAD family hydrolase [Filifactoraceae bacterium]
MKVDGIIFDLDGTLIDSMELWANLGKEYLLKKGCSPRADLTQHLEALSLEEGASYLKTTYGIEDNLSTILDDITKLIDYGYRHSIKLKSGVYTLLTSLKRKNVRLYIATATDKNLVDLVLRNNNIDYFFEGFITCSQVNKSKLSPEIFIAALKALGTNKESTLVVEDALHAIKTAKEVGFKVVAIKDRNNEWEEIKKIADYSIESFEDWSEIL